MRLRTCNLVLVIWSALAMLLALMVPAWGQNPTPIYNLAKTNVIRGTNWVASVSHPGATNGTRGTTWALVFSNWLNGSIGGYGTNSGFVWLTNGAVTVVSNGMNGQALTYSNGVPQWIEFPSAGGAATNAISTLKTNGTTVSAAATSLNLIAGTNVVLDATNTAGVVDVRINAAGSETKQYGTAGLTNISGTGAVTNKINSWTIWAKPTAVINDQMYFAEKYGAGIALFSNDFSGLLQNIVNRGIDGTHIHIAGNDYYTNKYWCSNTVTVTNFLVIEGAGNPSTVLRLATNSAGPIIQLGTIGNGISGIVRINKIRFEGGGGTTAGSGIKVVNCAEPIVQDCELNAFKFAGLWMNATNFVHWAYVDNSWFVMGNAAAHGILFDYPVTNSVDQNHFTIRNSIFTHNGMTHAITVSNYFPHLAIQNNHFRYGGSGAANGGIGLLAGGDYTISGNQFQGFASVLPIVFYDRLSATNYNSVVSDNYGSVGTDNLAVVGEFVQGIQFANNSSDAGPGLVLNGSNGSINNFDRYGLRLGTITASRALASDAEGNVTNSTATLTELGYLSGVGGAIQTQLNSATNRIETKQNGTLLLTNISATGAITNLQSASTTNSTYIALVQDGTNTTGRIKTVSAGANVTITPEGSTNLILAASGGAASTNVETFATGYLTSGGIRNTNALDTGSLTNRGDAGIAGKLFVATAINTSGNLSHSNGSSYVLINDSGIYGDDAGTFQAGNFNGPILDFITSTWSIDPAIGRASSLGAGLPFDTIKGTNVAIGKGLTVEWVAKTNAAVIHQGSGLNQYANLVVNTSLTELVTFAAPNNSNSVPIKVSFTQDSTGTRTLTFMGQVLGIDTNALAVTDVQFWIQNGTTNVSTSVSFAGGVAAKGDLWGYDGTNWIKFGAAATEGQTIMRTNSGVGWALVDFPAGGSGDITAVGDVTSGAAFDGSAGTALGFKNNAGQLWLTPTETNGTEIVTNTIPPFSGEVNTTIYRGRSLQITNTVEPTNIVNFTVPAGALGTNRVIYIPVHGRIWNITGNPTVRFTNYVSFGGTNFSTDISANIAAAATQYGIFTEFWIYAIGTAAQEIHWRQQISAAINAYPTWGDWTSIVTGNTALSSGGGALFMDSLTNNVFTYQIANGTNSGWTTYIAPVRAILQ